MAKSPLNMILDQNTLFSFIFCPYPSLYHYNHHSSSTRHHSLRHCPTTPSTFHNLCYVIGNNIQHRSNHPRRVSNPRLLQTWRLQETQFLHPHQPPFLPDPFHLVDQFKSNFSIIIIADNFKCVALGIAKVVGVTSSRKGFIGFQGLCLHKPGQLLLSL